MGADGEHYNLGQDYLVRIRWFPIIAQEFGHLLDEIAAEIGNEIGESVVVDAFHLYPDWFRFLGAEIMYQFKLFEEDRIIIVDADLVSWAFPAKPRTFDDLECPACEAIPASVAPPILH